MSCQGITEACKVLNTPVTGGNVSLYNDTKLSNNDVIPIHPTPVIGMVGLIENIKNVCKKSWISSGDQIWMIGLPIEINNLDSRITLSGSSYLEYIHGLKTGRPPEIDLNLEKNVHYFIREIIKNRFINSAHDISDGGLAVAIAECCISSGFGATINLPSSSKLRLDRLLFAEGGARILVSCSENQVKEMKNFFNNISSEQSRGFSISHLGAVNNENKLFIYQSNNLLVDLNILDLKKLYKNAIYKKVSK